MSDPISVSDLFKLKLPNNGNSSIHPSSPKQSSAINPPKNSSNLTISRSTRSKPISIPNTTSTNLNTRPANTRVVYRNGRDGRDGRNGVDGMKGENGLNGIDGAPGRNGINGSSSCLGSTFLSSTLTQYKLDDNCKFQEISLEQKQIGICTNWRSNHDKYHKWHSTDTGQYLLIYRVHINVNFDSSIITTARMASMLTLNNKPIHGTQVIQLTSSNRDNRELTASTLINYFAEQEIALQWWASGYHHTTPISSSINSTSISVGVPNLDDNPFCPATSSHDTIPFTQCTASLTILRVLLP